MTKQDEAAQRAEVEKILALGRDYLVDVFTLAILKARQHEIALDVDADGRGIASGIDHLENRLEHSGKALVAFIAEKSRS